MVVEDVDVGRAEHLGGVARTDVLRAGERAWTRVEGVSWVRALRAGERYSPSITSAVGARCLMCLAIVQVQLPGAGRILRVQKYSSALQEGVLVTSGQDVAHPIEFISLPVSHARMVGSSEYLRPLTELTRVRSLSMMSLKLLIISSSVHQSTCFASLYEAMPLRCEPHSAVSPGATPPRTEPLNAQTPGRGLTILIRSVWLPTQFIASSP